MSEWPEVDRFTDHWRWQPDWTAQRPRLLWYLTFEDVPDVRRLADPAAGPLRTAGADVIPTRWLHLTVSDIGFADVVDQMAAAAAAAAVRELLRDEPPLDLTLGTVAVLPGAVVLPARPRGSLARIRDAIRGASAGAGINPPDELDGGFWPHVSLCYINGSTDHEALWTMVRSAGHGTVRTWCDRLAQVLVTREAGHYRWKVLEEVRLGDGQREERGRAR